jgi:hypothetical protein
MVACSDFELPTPPDMSELVDEYQNPEGTLDPENAKMVAEEIRDTIEQARNGAPIELMDSLVGNLQKLGGGEADSQDAEADASDAEAEGPDMFDYAGDNDVAAGEQSVSGNRIDVGARVKVHHICRGWSAKKRIDEDENGTAELNLALDRQGLIPTIWGELDHCRLIRADTKVELTGRVRLHFGTHAPRVGLRALKQIGYLVELDGNLKAIRGETTIDLDADFTFWILENRQIHMKVDLPNGTEVVLVLAPAALLPIDEPMLEAGLRTRNATWDCKFYLADVSGSCVNLAGSEPDVTW